MKPTNAPAMASTLESPQVSSTLAKFTDFSNNSLISYIQNAAFGDASAHHAKPVIVHGPQFMASNPSMFSLSDLRRRDWLLRVGVSLAATPVWAQSGRDATLPAAQSLPDELARALKNKQPLIVMVSLDGCVFCRQARQSHLSPMARAGTAIVQVDMRNNQPVLDFAGKLTTHDQLTRQWKVSITPTLLFFGPGGKEVAERMEGAYQPDFYGPYLEDRMAQGRKAL
jgi:thioredoxin-related protein